MHRLDCLSSKLVVQLLDSTCASRMHDARNICTAQETETHNTNSGAKLLYLLEVLYIQHLHQSVDRQSLQDGVDGGRAHISADVLLQAKDPPLSLKLMAVAAHHVHKPPEGFRLHGGVLLAGAFKDGSREEEAFYNLSLANKTDHLC